MTQEDLGIWWNGEGLSDYEYSKKNPPKNVVQSWSASVPLLANMNDTVPWNSISLR